LIGDPWIASISWLVISLQTSSWASFDFWLALGTGLGVSRFLHAGEAMSREQSSGTKIFQRISNNCPPKMVTWPAY
jgi:hypothetical protein